MALRFSLKPKPGNRGLREIKADLPRVRRAQERAAVIALNRVGRDVERDAIGDLSAEVNVQKGQLRWHYNLDGQRTGRRRLVLARAQKGVLEVTIAWLPRGDRPTVRLGGLRPYQSRRGVRAGRIYVEQGFVPQAGAPRFGRKRGNVFARTSIGRYPIRIQEIQLREPADRIFGGRLASSGLPFRREFAGALTRALRTKAARRRA